MIYLDPKELLVTARSFQQTVETEGEIWVNRSKRAFPKWKRTKRGILKEGKRRKACNIGAANAARFSGIIYLSTTEPEERKGET